jgi:hypothetical protein
VNYFVAGIGHLAFFEQMDAARSYVADFGGNVFSLWGLGYRAPRS